MNIDDKISFGYAQIGDVNLHYAKAGAGETLVLLLHGFPEFWYSWRHQISALGDEYTVVAPDMRGFNLSDKPSGIQNFTVDKLADDIIGLIHYFGREKAAIVGHDWGAAIAWATAQKYPEHVSKLAALQVPPIEIWRKNQTLKQLLASWYMFFFQIPKLPEWLLSRNDFAMLEKSLRNSTAAKNVFTPEIIAEYKKAWREPFALEATINYYRANIIRRIFAKSETNNGIRVPTLFIYGEKDFAILPETVNGIDKFIEAPYTEFRIPTSGHWVQQEASGEVSKMLGDFLSEK